MVPRSALYLAGRLAGAIIALLAGALIVYTVMHAAPGDPALAVLGENARPEAVAAFRYKHHLDEPFAAQFWIWLSGILRGDFGLSLTIAGGIPISQLIAARLPITAFIGLYAVLIAVAISLTMGTVAALRRGRAADTIATSVAVLGISMPDFWLSYMLVFAFALGWRLFPAYGFVSPIDSPLGALYSGFLPALAIAAPMAAVFARMLRTSLLEASSREYVAAARSFGFSAPFVFRHYIFRNALIPYVTVIGLQIRYLLGGVVVIERIFGIQGLGSLMVDAAFARDYPTVLACTVVFLTVVLLVNVVVDLICVALDPRRST
ncbi:MAG TPA: ABC transporter permease [Alphaproteobacteria bacterium]|nr:ABC transporter permease [Alphaproteobacteria bacterium]